ncbi:YqeG family HAD IIIA-type phosphatase [Ileibacterium valens]|uniref:HAD family hydrolase n=1 Tax=Ileibacterium valens TaxID=1862668 RepID=A0A1U7NH81_9FIRM|nr:YqeG family HAD IIIA-type phosphatase [Ileibacterium valens]OLU38564.1 HAD family hydrolase [Erysipelotrichaceae bacterium NYU-BL-E8]OLU39884.1 HAD family hydrolase [Erysipelotrichaceae bacterium NYU-BL-F16]OLU40946.1 HAD family hydrolase [Ileibacterium valens]
MHLFKPDYYVKSFKYMDINRLKKMNIRLLLCDIDNTLVAFDEPHSNEGVRFFIEMVQSAGIQVALMSNNVKSRTEKFGQALGVRIYSFSCKPFPFTFVKAMKDFGVRADHTALIGDQLFTDMLGGNLAGITTILTAPIVERDKLDTKALRTLERFVFHHYEKKGIMKRGDFDD